MRSDSHDNQSARLAPSGRRLRWRLILMMLAALTVATAATGTTAVAAAPETPTESAPEAPPESAPETTPTEDSSGGSDTGEPDNEPGEVPIGVWIAAGALILIVIVWTVRSAGNKADEDQTDVGDEPSAPGQD
jgi:hypothetical protein